MFADPYVVISFLINLWQPATTEYVVKDTGNCSPRYMRCTINQVIFNKIGIEIATLVLILYMLSLSLAYLQIPCTSDLLGTSGMQLALLVQPLALPHPSEEVIQVTCLFFLVDVFDEWIPCSKDSKCH